MSLTPEEKARIRREEEERVRIIEEVRYREEVRAELEAGRGSDETPRAPRGAGPWWWIASALLIAALVATVIAFVVGAPAPGGDDDDEGPTDVELELAAGGPLGPVARPPWSPADLSTDTFVEGADGHVTRTDKRGVASRADLAAAFASPAPVMNDPFPRAGATLAELEARYKASPPDMAQPRMGLAGPKPPAATGAPTSPPATATSTEALDGLLRFVPPSSWLVVGLQRAGTSRSPTLTRVRGEYLHALSRGDARTLDMVDADALVHAAVVAGGDAFDDLMIAATSADSEALSRALVDAGASAREGVVPWLATPGDAGFVIEPGRFAAAREEALAPMLAARTTDCILWSGDLASMVRHVRGANAVWLAASAVAFDSDELDALAPGLGKARTIGAAIDVGVTIELRLVLDFPDELAATHVLAGLEQRRLALDKSDVGELLGRIAPTIVGPRLTLAGSLSEEELARLLVSIGDP